MKRKLHIALFIVMAGFACILLSCGISKEEKQETMNDQISLPTAYEVIPPADNELEQSFETDTLNNEQLGVFQQRARQKLQDFINYIEIISNKTYDPQLRLEARKQVSEIFADSTIMVNVSIENKTQTSKPITEFLNNVYQSEYDSIKIKTDSVVVNPPQKVAQSTNYLGMISAKVNIIGYKNSSVIFESNIHHQAVTIIHKTQKQFGMDKKMVWIVAIGELK